MVMPPVTVFVFALLALVALWLGSVLLWRFVTALVHDFWAVHVWRRPQAQRRLPDVLGGWPGRHGLLTLLTLVFLLAMLFTALKVIARVSGL
jgi:hypothetical protein